jgi:predicted RecB family nuclease
MVFTMAEQLYIRPSDARSWLHCKRRVWYDNFPPEGMVQAEPDPFEELVKQLGIRHEWGIKRDLEQQFQMVEATSVEHTEALMEAGVDIIYQAQIANRQNKIIGEPDFLIRHESGEYQPADAKLARSGDKKEIQIQLGAYRELLNSTLPALIFLGDKSTVETGDEANKEAEKFLADMRGILSLRKIRLKLATAKASARSVRMSGFCKPVFEAKEDLTLLYGIDSRAAPHLGGTGHHHHHPAGRFPTRRHRRCALP